MSSTAEHLNQVSRLDFSLSPNGISFDVDESLYPLEAIYGACYLFIDRCFVYLSRPQPTMVRVRLTTREPAKPAELDTLAGELANELLSQVTRLRLAQATTRIREYYTAAALRAGTAAPSVDELLAEIESEELLEEPLEIMVPWEEKHASEQKERAPKKESEGDG